MASETFPEYAIILTRGYSETSYPAPSRTSLEDGAVDQASLVSRLGRRWSINLIIPEPQAMTFIDWIRRINSDEFNISLDGVMREVRLVGGAASVSLEKVEGQRYKGERYRNSSIEVESILG